MNGRVGGVGWVGLFVLDEVLPVLGMLWAVVGGIENPNRARTGRTYPP